MKSISIKTALLVLVLSTWYCPSNAQQISTAVMNVSVEVVSGSQVAMNQNDILSLNDSDYSSITYAVVSIKHDEENMILTSSSDSMTLINGFDTFDMETTSHELRTQNGELEIHFTATQKTGAKSGFYTGKQIAEIIYL